MKMKIHFTDNYGPATLETDDEQAYINILNDPECEDVWCEYWDEEEGWTA